MPLVFTYGPETLQGRMYDRIGPSNCLGSAVLRDYELAFDKPNVKKKGEGLPNVVPKDGGAVFGLLFDLTPDQVTTYDGFYGGYGRENLSVVPDGVETPRSAVVWVARRKGKNLMPSAATIEKTLKGMEENGADEAFVEAVRALEVHE